MGIYQHLFPAMGSEAMLSLECTPIKALTGTPGGTKDKPHSVGEKALVE